MSNDEHEKSIPQILIDDLARMVREERREKLQIQDRLKNNPWNIIDKMFLICVNDDLQQHEAALKEMKEFYGKENLIS
jgi:hypothetical protein